MIKFPVAIQELVELLTETRLLLFALLRRLRLMKKNRIFNLSQTDRAGT
jgi:hypothetical protein